MALWGIQLEIGSVATPLEKLDPRYDLANCQRFYQVGQVAFGGNSPTAGAGGQYASAYFGVVMRAAPAVTTSQNNSANFTISGWSGLASNSGVTLAGTIPASGGYSINANFIASADL
jgi:hypothetical protein